MIPATPTDELNLSRQVDALRVIDARRRAMGMSVEDLEARSGVSVSSFYSYMAPVHRRNPGLGNIIALAESVGLEVVMQPRRPSGRSSQQNEE